MCPEEKEDPEEMVLCQNSKVEKRGEKNWKKNIAKEILKKVNER